MLLAAHGTSPLLVHQLETTQHGPLGSWPIPSWQKGCDQVLVVHKCAGGPSRRRNSTAGCRPAELNKCLVKPGAAKEIFNEAMQRRDRFDRRQGLRILMRNLGSIARILLQNVKLSSRRFVYQAINNAIWFNAFFLIASA